LAVAAGSTQTINALTPLGWNLADPAMEADDHGASEGNDETHLGPETERGGLQNTRTARMMEN